MAEKTLIAKVTTDDKDPHALLIASPVVGIADGAPTVGTFLNPFDPIVTMKILNQRYVLRLPRDRHGRVTEAFIPNGYTPVEFGQPLARLDPRVPELTADGIGQPAGAAGVTGETEDADLITIPAPSEGIFYRRPSPDSPPFVEVGSAVKAGSVLGLVEIMKCFYQVTYDGPGLPDKGEIAKVLADDASEVHFNQALFKIQPVD